MSHSRFAIGFSRHRKIRNLSDAAFRLWASAIDHIRDQGGDGELAEDDMDVIPKCPRTGKKRESLVRELVDAGLWDETPGGWQIHHYRLWQDDAETVRTRRERARERMKRVRANTPTNVRANGPPNVRKNKGANVRAPFATDVSYHPAADLNSDLYPADPDPDPGLRVGALQGCGTPLALPPPPVPPRPGNITEALGFPLKERAAVVLGDPCSADYLEPQRWPEVQAIAAIWGETRLGQYHRDSAVRALISAFAAGYTQAELELVSRTLPSSGWAKKQAAKGLKLGMAAMSLEVIRRQLDESQETIEPGTLVDAVRAAQEGSP